jgi:hypothetical protein
MSNKFIGLALGTVSEKLTPEQTAKANRVLQHAQQKHYAKVRKQRSKRK